MRVVGVKRSVGVCCRGQEVKAVCCRGQEVSVCVLQGSRGQGCPFCRADIRSTVSVVVDPFRREANSAESSATPADGSERLRQIAAAGVGGGEEGRGRRGG